jgi:RND family efflux transporter MFP subunit
MNAKRISFYSGVCLLLSLVCCGVLAQPTRVVVAPVAVMPEQGKLSLAGELGAIRTTLLSAEVEGSVASVLAESGDRVAAGAVLAVIREQPAQLQLQALQARVKEAQAGVERARINERRLSRLLPRKAVSQDEYDTARVELARTEAILAVRRAEASQQADQLARHHIRAPFEATIVVRQVELGQWLDVGDPCYQLDDTSTLRAVLAVPQQYYTAIREGAAVQVRYDAMPDQVFDLVLSRKLPTVRRAGRSFEIWLDVDNSKQLLVPGLSLQAEIPLQTMQGNRVLVSRDAVMKQPDGKAWVWLLEQSAETHTVRRVDVVVTGAVGSGLVVSSAELDPGMQVITRGNEALHEGQSVQIVDAS